MPRGPSSRPTSAGRSPSLARRRPASGGRARPVRRSRSRASTSPPSHRAVGTQRYRPLVHVPRGRPRTTRPSIASWGSTLDATLWVVSKREPPPTRRRLPRLGTAFARSVVNASPCSSRNRSAAADARASQADGRCEIALSTIICSSLRRSRAAIVRVAAAYTTGTSSRGTTNSVRRMQRIRTRSRSSYRLRSTSGGSTPSVRAWTERNTVTGSVECSTTSERAASSALVVR